MIDVYIHDNVSYKYFCKLKHKYKPREGDRGTQIPHNFDLMHKVGRLNIPPFDG
jgi:hypothetical protein